MPKYFVTVEVRWVGGYEVDATNMTEAEEIGVELAMDDFNEWDADTYVDIQELEDEELN